MEKVKAYIWKVLVSVDQVINTILAPILNRLLNPTHKFGDPDETLSSVFGKNVESGNCKACYYICRLLHLVDPDHCQKSVERDEGDKASTHK